MQGRPPAALGGGAYVAGAAAAVTLLAAVPLDAAAAAAVGGFCLGIVAGGLLVTRTRLLGREGTAGVLGFPVGLLVAWVTWTGIQSGAGGRYQFAIGSAFLAIVGWAVLIRGGQPGEPTDSDETLAVLPRTTDSGRVADGRWRWLKLLADVGVLAVAGYAFYRGAVQSDTSSWLFGGLFLAVFLPGTRSVVRLTADGLATTRYVCWVVPFDRSRTPWAEIYGYEATDERLRIATEFGRDLVYDGGRIDDRDRVVGVLDDHVPRL